MISQLVAAASARRVGRLVQMASKDGTINLDGGKEARWRMARLFRRPDNRQNIKDYLFEDAVFYGAWQVEPDDTQRAVVEKAYTQEFSCGGSARHALATLVSGDRREHSRRIQAKTLVLHGVGEPCIASHRGEGAANPIPNPMFKLRPGVGHIVDDTMCSAALDWRQNDHVGPSL